jgi:hypothetical protein
MIGKKRGETKDSYKSQQDKPEDQAHTFLPKPPQRVPAKAVPVDAFATRRVVDFRPQLALGLCFND